MNTPSRTAISLAGAAVLGLLAVGSGPDAVLRASSPSSQPLADTDGDGLHDLLEIRLGTRYDQADSDADGASDLEEYLSRRDPLIPNGPADGILDGPSVRLNLYEEAGTTYVQLFACFEQEITAVSVGIGNQNLERWVPGSRTVPLLLDRSVAQSSVPSVRILAATFPADSTKLKTLMPASLGVVALIDGEYVGDELPLVEVDNEIMEIRALDAQGQTPATNSPLGLFPAMPEPQPQRDTNANEVCVQALQVAGALSGGRLLYTVGEAYCDFLPAAVCIANCELTAGDTVVGLDIPGLLGSLGN